MTMDRLSFDISVSQHVQGDLQWIVGQLEAAISQRTSDVNHAMADFQADGVSEEYRSVEQRWHRAANEVRHIIHLVKTTMGRNDEIAHSTLSRARSLVQNID